MAVNAAPDDGAMCQRPLAGMWWGGFAAGGAAAEGVAERGGLLGGGGSVGQRRTA